MKWFQVFIYADNSTIASQKILFRNFFKLLIEEEFPIGLAMHRLSDDLKEENIRYFSTPDKYYLQLQTYFEGFNYKEISEPNLQTIKTLLGALN